MLRNRRVSAPRRSTGCASGWWTPTSRSGCTCPGWIRAAPTCRVAGSVLLDTILRRLGAEEITLCDLALREGLVLDYIHRNSARIRKVERYPDVRRRSVVELGERCGYWSEHAQQVARLALSIFDQTRSVHGLADREREWLEYGALLHDVGVHISYERHHRHSYYLIKNGDLRGFDPQEIEVIALLARYHRQATPKKSHEGYGDLPGALRRTVRDAVGDGAAGRGARSQPRAGARRHRPVPARRRLSRPAARDRRRRAGALGGAPARGAAREGARQADPVRGRRHRLTRSNRLMLNNLTTPHEYPESCSSSKASTGPERRRSSPCWRSGLAPPGHPVFVTEWNSSALVKAATKTGKKKNSLTPMTFSLLHATDFADRLLYNIIPPLKAGMIVLADRYAYTAFARDAARGVDRRWVRELYSFAVKPDLAVYFRVPIEVSTDRLLARRVKLKFYEAGMDMGWSSNAVESFRIFQGKVLDEYDRLVDEFGLSVVNAIGSITDQQRTFRKLVSQHLEIEAVR